MTDANLLAFHYLDHLHEPILRAFGKRIPAIASSKAVQKVKELNHFGTIKVLHDFSADDKTWNSRELHPGGLPRWLTPIRMLDHHELNYCLSLVWTHSRESGQDIHEAIFQSSHGTRLEEGPLQAFLDSTPPTQKLAILHGLKESFAMGSRNTLGVAGGLALFETFERPKYWVVSHKSPLECSGIVMRTLFMHDIPRNIE